MSRKKSSVVLPQPAASMLRRSARLISLQNRDAQDLASNSEPPRKIRRKLEGQVYSSVWKKSNTCVDGLRRSLRVSNSDANRDNATKPASPSCGLRRSPRFSSGGASVNLKSGNRVLSKCSISSGKGKHGDSVRSRQVSGRNCTSLSRPETEQMSRDCHDDEEEASVCVRIEEENAHVGKRIVKTKVVAGWTQDLELALQGAYLTVKPCPNFWKKVSKLVPGKSPQECFDRVNSDLSTPRQPPPRSRARKSNLSPLPHFSLSASKLLKPISPKTKIPHRRNCLSKKTIRHLLDKQNHMDQGLGFDLFSVFEPGTTSNLLSTPTEKGQRLPKILESPLLCSRFSTKEQTTLVSPPVLKLVKNKALHDKYIDHLHVREAKRNAQSTRLAGKENIRPIDIQKKDSVKAVKDALLFDVQDAIQKLKGLEADNSSSSSEFYYGLGETDEEDESVTR